MKTGIEIMIGAVGGEGVGGASCARAPAAAQADARLFLPSCVNSLPSPPPAA